MGLPHFLGRTIAHAVVGPGQGVDGKMFFEKRMWRFDGSVCPELGRIITMDSFYNFTSPCTVRDGVTYTPAGNPINSHGLLVWAQQWLRHSTLRERVHRQWQAGQRTGLETDQTDQIRSLPAPRYCHCCPPCGCRRCFCNVGATLHGARYTNPQNLKLLSNLVGRCT